MTNSEKRRKVIEREMSPVLFFFFNAMLGMVITVLAWKISPGRITGTFVIGEVVALSLATLMFYVVVRYIMMKKVEEWGAEDQSKFTEQYQKSGNAAAIYLLEFVRQWEEGVHGVLFVEAVRPGLQFLAEQVKWTAEDKIRTQQIRLEDGIKEMTRQEEEKLYTDQEENFRHVRKNFWDVRDGLVATEIPAVQWLKHEVTYWKQALILARTDLGV